MRITVTLDSLKKWLKSFPEDYTEPVKIFFGISVGQEYHSAEAIGEILQTLDLILSGFSQLKSEVILLIGDYAQRYQIQIQLHGEQFIRHEVMTKQEVSFVEKWQAVLLSGKKVLPLKDFEKIAIQKALEQGADLIKALRPYLLKFRYPYKVELWLEKIVKDYKQELKCPDFNDSDFENRYKDWRKRYIEEFSTLDSSQESLLSEDFLKRRADFRKVYTATYKNGLNYFKSLCNAAAVSFVSNLLMKRITANQPEFALGFDDNEYPELSRCHIFDEGAVFVGYNAAGIKPCWYPTANSKIAQITITVIDLYFRLKNPQAAPMFGDMSVKTSKNGSYKKREHKKNNSANGVAKISEEGNLLIYKQTLETKGVEIPNDKQISKLGKEEESLKVEESIQVKSKSVVDQAREREPSPRKSLGKYTRRSSIDDTSQSPIEQSAPKEKRGSLPEEFQSSYGALSENLASDNAKLAGKTTDKPEDRKYRLTKKEKKEKQLKLVADLMMLVSKKMATEKDLSESSDEEEEGYDSENENSTKRSLASKKY